MTDQQAMWFKQLHERRSISSKNLDDPAVEGLKDRAVYNYSDQAHFVYELLQNADDKEAAVCRFVLFHDRLIFAHNAPEQFTISNPNTEREDKKEGKKGDINSILSYYNNNKPKKAIGKFGIGFKSVLQYTDKPEIHDDTFHFCIENQIVPVELPHDEPERGAGETLFVFPFRSDEADKAYAEISDKLKGLNTPLLFLPHMIQINYTIGEEQGCYRKQVLEEAEKTTESINVKKIALLHEPDEKKNAQYWVFSRTDINGYICSIAFARNENEMGGLRPQKASAYCFFATKEQTGLHFLIHAPFKMNDSRDVLDASSEHNQSMIQSLAKLAADSLPVLRNCGQLDENILKILPLNASALEGDNKDKLSFAPFFTEIQQAMRTQAVLPTKDGFITREHAFLADTKEMAKLFSNEQLSMLMGDPEAKWVFPSVSVNYEIKNYLNILQLSQYEILNKITADFIENQSISWLHRFYRWISMSTRRYFYGMEPVKYPIFLNQQRRAMPAVDEKGQYILFLPREGRTSDRTILDQLLQDRDTEQFFREIGISEESDFDFIYNEILKRYDADQSVAVAESFRIFFEYYENNPKKDGQKLIGLLKKYPCLFPEGRREQARPDQLYYPSKELRDYFETKPDTQFVDLGWCRNSIGAIEYTEKAEDLDRFLDELGVNQVIRLASKALHEENPSEKTLALQFGFSLSNSPREWIRWYYPILDGSDEILNEIIKEDREKAETLWNALLGYIEKNKAFDFNSTLRGKRTFRPEHKKNLREEPIESPISKRLKTEKWLLRRDGALVSPVELTLQQMDARYDITSPGAKALLSFLGIQDDMANLTDEQKQMVRRGSLVEELGLSEEELREAANLKRRKQQPAANRDAWTSDGRANRFKQTTEFDDYSVDGDLDVEAPAWNEATEESADREKRFENVKKRYEEKIKTEERKKELYHTLDEAGPYTYLWFRTLLELEAAESDNNEAGSREISIRFGQIAADADSPRALTLIQPDRYIPSRIEDLNDFRLDLATESGVKSVTIEAASVRRGTLRVLMKNPSEIKGIDLEKVYESSINVKNPGFLLQSLRDGFESLGLPDEFNMKQNLCENIRFIFGPPGTGKTTTVARDELIPLMNGSEECRVLVLTPTNKAADVLVKRIMTLMEGDGSYKRWLIRFGTPNDPEIEKSPVYRERSFSLGTLSHCVVVTTVARFPYDAIGGQRLNDYPWDYVVIDEASMIPLPNLIYPLYKITPRQFVISGDPHQIQPVAKVKPEENIYRMVGLDSFSNPKTEPHDYEVRLLSTQYRSVPAIGELFSQFAYDGMLRHARAEETRTFLGDTIEIELQPLNLIRFPVTRYESVYRAKYLGSSSYQIYSALFSYELARHLADRIAQAEMQRVFRIGIISPYRVQANIIDRLVLRTDLPGSVTIQADTVHGFQGDECDLVIAVLNPPEIGVRNDAERVMINNKNVINVAISRASDYLIAISPDSNTDSYEKLIAVRCVNGLIQKTDAHTEFQSSEIEELLFGDERYLENNTFFTSHQNVNVYGLPNARYEVRTDDQAIDVQIQENAT